MGKAKRSFSRPKSNHLHYTHGYRTEETHDIKQDIEVEEDVFMIKMLLERLKSLLNQSDTSIAELQLENEALRKELRTLRHELNDKEKRIQLLETIM